MQYQCYKWVVCQKHAGLFDLTNWFTQWWLNGVGLKTIYIILQLTTYSDNEIVQVHHGDLALTSHMGLHMMLKQMGENHGFFTNIVNRVYKHSNSLEETNNILHAMWEAAQEWGEQEIKHRSKRRKVWQCKNWFNIPMIKYVCQSVNTMYCWIVDMLV